jgi:signal transduction histidine kinase/ActR/RegA family two-component response regulator
MMHPSLTILQQVIDAIPQYVAWKDTNLVYIGCNQQFARAVGLNSPIDIVGLTEHDMPWSAEAERLEADDHAVLTTGEPQKHALQWAHMFGDRMAWIGTNRVLLRDNQNQISGVLVSHADVTERITAQKALQRGEAILSAAGLIAELLLRTSSWKACVDEIVQLLGEATQVSQVHIHMGIVDEHGVEMARQIGVWSGVSALSPMLHSDIPIDSSNFAGWRAAIDSGQAFMTHVQDLPEVERKVLEAFHVRSFAGVPIMVRDQSWGIIGLYEHAEERSWSVAEIDALKVVAATFGAAVEREMTQESLLQSQKLESIGLLAGGIAHDFNNLLQGMLGQTTLALSLMPSTNQARLHVEKAVVSAEKAADLTRQLLAYAGHGQFQRKHHDLNAIVRDNVTLLESILPEHVIVDLQLTEPLPSIFVDQGQIQQVIMNLIINAGEAMGDQPGGRLTITTKPGFLGAMEDRPSVCLLISDTGCGIHKKDFKRIFDPYYTTKPSGSGLGLAAIQGIVKAHDGRIKVESTPGSGSTFRVCLPAAPEANVMVQPSPISAEITPPNKTILVIEDEAAVRDVVVDILTMADWHVLQAADGATGIEVFAQHIANISLVMLDMQMPGLNGAETFVELVALRPDIPILISSGYSQNATTPQFGNAQNLSFLQKPYRLQTLLDAVNAAIAPTII